MASKLTRFHRHYPNAPTERQLDVLHCIKECLRTEGRPPTIKEGTNLLGFKSTYATRWHIAKLRQKGHLKTIGGARNLIPTTLWEQHEA